MTAKTNKSNGENKQKQRQQQGEQKQIPFGDGNQISNRESVIHRKGEMQRFLHCAADDLAS